MLILPARLSLESLETLHQAFAAVAARSPDDTALTFRDEQVTYGALEAASNRLARRLVAAGIGPESRVGLIFERSLEMMTALLGVLKAGGAYVPLDPGAPTERLRFIAQDCGARLMLSTCAVARRFESGFGIPTIHLDSPEVVEELAGASGHALDDTDQPFTPDPDNLAYVIYTSGSAGRPKGVAVTHRNVLRLFSSTRRWFDHRPDDVRPRLSPWKAWMSRRSPRRRPWRSST